MKKILLSIATLGIVGAAVIGGTTAIFSDTEVSEGNTFTAGAIDLTVDNESYYNGELNTGTSWLQPANLDDGQGPGSNGEYWFFDFRDLKPGDWGEDTISLHVNNNDSWLCADVKLTSNQDNGSTEPELNDEDPYTGTRGELADHVNFIWWADDGDNVYETDEVLLPAGSLGSLAVGQTATVVLADSSTNIWDANGPLPGDSVRYIGKAWCFGNLTETPVAPGDNDPLVNPGFSCNGSQENNETQTDSLTADISFRAEQARHNENFVCDLGGPVVEQRHISLENKNSDWSVIADDLTWGDIDYSHNDTTFHGIVTGQGLEPNSKYQITLNGPVEASGTCGFTNLSLGNFGANTFQSGFWNSAAPNLSSTCTAGDEEGLYNMDLIGDHYTIITDGTGAFTHNFNIALPAGDYSGVKVLVKKMLDTHVSPWTDTGPGYPAFNLYETASISFTVI